MAQLVIRKIDDAVRERLKARARRNGRSLEAEARVILEEAANGGRVAKRAPKRPAKRPLKKEKGFGTLMHERFKKVGLTDEEWKLFNEGIEELRRGDVLEPVDFDK
jgi:plasmid stability protein